MSGSRFQLALFTFLFPVAASTCLAGGLEWVKVSDDGKGFVLASGGLAGAVSEENGIAHATVAQQCRTQNNIQQLNEVLLC